MSDLDALIAVLTTEDVVESPAGFRQRITDARVSVPADGSFARPIRVEFKDSEDATPMVGSAAVLLQDERGNSVPYVFSAGSSRGEYQLFDLDTYLSRIDDNITLGARDFVWLSDAPLTFEAFASLQAFDAVKIDIHGLGADGLFDAAPEVQSDVFVPEVPESPEPLGLVDNFTQQADPSSVGDSTFVIRPDGDVVATNEARLAPNMPDAPSLAGEDGDESIITRRGTLREPDEGVQLAGKPGVLSTGGAVPTVEEAEAAGLLQPLDDYEKDVAPKIDPPGVVDGHPPYDGQEDIAVWLKREHYVDMPSESGTFEAEFQLSDAVSMVAAQIADGNIAPNAQEAILEEFSKYDDPKFGENRYRDYLEELFDEAVGLGHDAVSARDYDLNVLQSDRANVLHDEQADKPAPLNGGAGVLPNLDF